MQYYRAVLLQVGANLASLESLVWFSSLSEGIYSESSKILKTCQAIAGPSLLASQTDLPSFSQTASYWLVAGI